MTQWNEYSPLRRIALRHVEDAFRDQATVDTQWRDLGYAQRPDFCQAREEYEVFLQHIRSTGAQIDFLPRDSELTLDALYVRDATLVSPAGLIACSMGKALRGSESTRAIEALSKAGLPVLGAIQGEGRLEGGDLIWLDARTCAAGRSYRTNEEGIRQLRDLLGDSIRVLRVPLPHYKGPGDVFHLMSVISPLDHDLALVFSPLLPIPFREWLIDRGMTLVEVPESEFETMGCNVLALAPRSCLMVAGNPETQKRLEAAGCKVLTYPGWEISRKGEGGPTCLTRPLVRG